MEWEKILANEVIVKGFISKIYEQLYVKKTRATQSKYRQKI